MIKNNYQIISQRLLKMAWKKENENNILILDKKLNQYKTENKE
jgi:hypothetical protein